MEIRIVGSDKGKEGCRKSDIGGVGDVTTGGQSRSEVIGENA